MLRANYDTDVTTWSPQGRLFQVEYAMEAVKQGSAVVGLKSKEFVVLCALRRRTTQLESYQQKLYKIDDHLGVGVAGLTADARVLHRYMRNECLNHKYVYDAPLNIGRLAANIGQKSQKATQSASKRPYGVGLLLAGADKTGTHLYETSPSGNIYDYMAIAIGGRSQSAKTYLERQFETFDGLDMDALIHHGLTALSKCLEQDAELKPENVSVAVVGVDQPYRDLTEEELVAALAGVGAPAATAMEVVSQ
jgi:20S proteasome subunit alpha 6